MKLLINTLLSIFFAIAIGVHVYYVYEGDSEPFWWHCIYFITYGVCWWMLFSKSQQRNLIYLLMSIFSICNTCILRISTCKPARFRILDLPTCLHYTSFGFYLVKKRKSHRLNDDFLYFYIK
jgi:hypothetical protein